MSTTKKFDVLVVYNEMSATSATCKDDNIRSPFDRIPDHKQYNRAYAFFLKTCSDNNLEAALSTSADIIGPGLCKSYWLYQHKKWTKVNKKCYSQLMFDKISPISRQSAKRKLLFSDSKIHSFNNSELCILFSDKQQTYDSFKEFSIPTAAIEKNTRASVHQALVSLKELLATHPQPEDFSDKFVLKDRFGFGGDGIFSIDAHNAADQILLYLSTNKNIRFVLQPFAQFKNGYQYQNYRGFIDIRVIYMGNKAIQAYIRIAKPNEFRCNEHQGGTVEYIVIKDVPTNVINVANKMLETLDNNGTLCALDFIISDSGNVYLMEGNINPGIYWNASMKDDERMSKQLIRVIVKELAERATVYNLVGKLPSIKIPQPLINPLPKTELPIVV